MKEKRFIMKKSATESHCSCSMAIPLAEKYNGSLVKTTLEEIIVNTF